MTRSKSAPAEAPAPIAPDTGGSFERQPDGSLKRLNDIVEDSPEPAAEQPVDETKEG